MGKLLPFNKEKRVIVYGYPAHDDFGDIMFFWTPDEVLDDPKTNTYQYPTVVGNVINIKPFHRNDKKEGDDA